MDEFELSEARFLHAANVCVEMASSVADLDALSDLHQQVDEMFARARETIACSDRIKEASGEPHHRVGTITQRIKEVMASMTALQQ